MPALFLSAAVLAIPSVAAAQAGDRAMVYCGGTPSDTCESTYTQLSAAFATAGAAGTDVLGAFPADLTPYRLIFVYRPNAGLAAEQAALVAFHAAGGFLIGGGEYSTFNAGGNAVLNTLATAAGVTLTADGGQFDCGCGNLATVDTTHPLMAGVTNIEFACAGSVGGGSVLASGSGGPIYAIEGNFIMVGDANSWDDLCGTSNYGATENLQFWINLWAFSAPGFCGNGIVSLLEDCDDGNVVDGDGCDSNCTLTGCGNGIVTAGEACDDGNAVEGDGCDSNCTVSACGNGVVGGSEGCDDGNATDGDGCDSNCTTTGCGNGVVTAGEECDDGNTTAGDGCDGACMTEGAGGGGGEGGAGAEGGGGSGQGGSGADGGQGGAGNGGAGNGGAGNGGSGASGNSDDDDGDNVDSSGCSCEVPGSNDASGSAWLLLLALPVAVLGRRANRR
jgi:cysteine-rich repeat protein